MSRIFDEKFENTGSPGYDESWTESVGASSTIDENADPADVTTKANWGGECLKLICAGGVTNYAYSQVGDGAIRYSRAEMYITDLSGFDVEAELACVFAGINNALATYCWKLFIYYTTGATYFGFQPYPDGTPGSAIFAGPIFEDTFYRTEVKWDSTNDLYEFKVNGSSFGGDSLVSGYVEQGAIVVGDVNAGVGYTAYLDLVAIDNADWVGEDSLKSFSKRTKPIFFIIYKEEGWL